MAWFRDGETVVEAFQFTEESKNQVFNFVRCNCYADFIDGEPALRIETPNGEETARFGDWVVKKGSEFYPCSLEVFEATYEPAS